MPRQIQLSVDDVRLLREIVETAGIKRQQLCKSSKVSTGWLSLLLSPKGQQPRKVDADMVKRLSDVLLKQLTKSATEQKLSEEKLTAILSFLSRFTEAAVRWMPPKIYLPGGPVPVDADHYISRPTADGKLQYALQVHAFTMIVRGPVQSGKSSLLAQLESKARAKGWETAWFDPWVGSALEVGKQSADIFTQTARSFAKTLEAEWKLEPPGGRGIEFREDLSNWLFSELESAPIKPRLLILDDLGALGAKTTEEWLSFVRLIDTKRAHRDIQISVAVGMTHHFGPYYVRMLEDESSIVAWDPKIEIAWFTKEETEELEKALTNKKLNLHRLFQGQPYLTHAAATDEAFRKAVERWNRTKASEDQPAVVGSQPYKRHLKKIRLSILGPPWHDRTHSLRLIESFVEICRRSRSTSGSVAELKLEADDKRFLETAKLIDANLKPTLSLYNLIAEDLKEESNPLV